MRIILATPIYPPEIGGPAIYSQKLKEGLEKEGHAVRVVSYLGFKKHSQPLRIFLYFLELFRNAQSCDLIYAFNLTSCGLPACLSGKILRKKFLIRVGGDFLWERAVEAGRTKKPLLEYYQDKKTLKEKFWIFLVKMVFTEADTVIFTSDFQRNIYLQHFNLSREKTVIIQNPFPRPNFQIAAGKPSNYQILYAGRLLKLKNLDLLIRAFDAVLSSTGKNLTLRIIGAGPERENLDLRIENLGLRNKAAIAEPLPHADLLKEIQRSYLCVLPSLTEITPNFALECLKLQKPILLTKETGYYEIFKNDLIFIDPRNEADLVQKIAYLLDENKYLDYIEKIKTIPTYRSWDDVVQEHEESFIHRSH